ncbi:hypothetical protein GCM10009846_19730 [Agrococcus versicolor]|uniref:Fibronectin type-III domain-containing protein n=1 Tax=Agrococcus versicolor TaxID=501482 RepID=A0ABN3ASP9_9MICO
MTAFARVRLALLAIATMLLLPAFTAVEATEAAWNDSEHGSVAGLSSTNLVGPVKRDCPTGLGSFTVRWTQPAGGVAAGYVLTATNVATNAVTTYTAGSGATQIPVTTLLGSVTGATYTLRLTRELGGWSSPVLQGTATVYLAGLTAACSWNP